MEEFDRVRRLQQLPRLVGAAAFRSAAHSPGRRPGILGTLAVTSLGHGVVDGFHSNGGTTITLGLGRVAPRPVVRAGRVTVAPVMRLSLAFDHRVIDGAEAADVLGDLAAALTGFVADATPAGDEAGDTTSVGDPAAAGDSGPVPPAWRGRANSASPDGTRSMHDVAELKRYAEVHARAQRIHGFRDVLDRIDSDQPGGDGSWVREWRRSADALRERGQALAAVRHDTMARFPYVDSPARREAQDLAVATFERWSRDRGIEALEVLGPGGRIRCWTYGLSARRPRPLLLVCGGIVSTKEQWAPALAGLGRLGFAGVVTELPGVGENTLRYQEDAGG